MSRETATASATQASATVTETATATRTGTPTSTATPGAPTPVPTPTAYNGAVTRLSLPRFGVDGAIEELYLNAAGELDTPRDENNGIAFYPTYDKPGRANPDNLGWISLGGRPNVPSKGNSVFSAHVYYNNVPAPFKNLYYSPAIAVNDEIVVTMEDGRQYKYVVIEKTQYNRDTIPMGEVIWPSKKPANEEWITLISCGGALDSSGQEYVDRIVVIGKRVDDTATTAASSASGY